MTGVRPGVDHRATVAADVTPTSPQPVPLAQPDPPAPPPVSPRALKTVCAYCDAPAPRLYLLPLRARVGRHQDGPACHFCFLRLAGIKPDRRHLAPPDGALDGHAAKE